MGPFVLKSTMERKLEEKENEVRNFIAECRAADMEFKSMLVKEVGDAIDPFHTVLATVGILATNMPEITHALSEIAKKKSHGKPARRR